MRKAGTIALMVVVAAGLAFLAYAGEKEKTVTLSGSVACAHCTLKLAGVKECQDVLVVSGEGAGQYYLVKNDVL